MTSEPMLTRGCTTETVPGSQGRERALMVFMLRHSNPGSGVCKGHCMCPLNVLGKLCYSVVSSERMRRTWPDMNEVYLLLEDMR